ncbi:hypothetical protein V8G54_002250 [Vigna mungo]|uniref:Uncharacterized protein n=1 Tax=Vigna mungo TaxID=3915 RepID=A0AAQ3P9S2_VIGMU
MAGWGLLLGWSRSVCSLALKKCCKPLAHFSSTYKWCGEASGERGCSPWNYFWDRNKLFGRGRVLEVEKWENRSILYKERLKMEKEERKKESETGKERLEGLPIEDSPYVQYKDLEDYKQQGYGTQGHQEPKTGRGAGATEAPTLSGSASTATATAANNHKGIP